MTDAKIIDFKSHQKLRERLQKEDAKTIIDEQRTELRQMEEVVQNLLFIPHKLKAAQNLKDKTIREEYNLTRIIDWLEGKTTEAATEEQKAAAQALIKQCEQLIARNERIKKNIADDISTCRYVEGKEALDPMKIAGFLIGTPLGFAALTKSFIIDKPEATWQAGEVGAAVGVYVSFHRQINRAIVAAAATIASTPRHLTHIKRKAKFSSVALALTASVATKQKGDINPRHPSPNTVGTKIVVAAKL